jgi:hypothetical protein
VDDSGAALRQKGRFMEGGGGDEDDGGEAKSEAMMTVGGRKAHRFKIKSHYASSGTCWMQ